MKKNLSLIAFLSIIVISLFFHMQDFQWIVHEWRFNSYYTHGWYVLIASLLYAGYRYNHIDWDRVSSHGPFWFMAALFWWGISAILYWAGNAFNPDNIHHYLRTLAFLFMLRGLISFMLRERVAKAFSFPIFYPIFAIPFPFFDKISETLRDGTMYVSTWIFNMFGIAKSISLPIASTFTGIESLILLVTLVVLVVYVSHSRDIVKLLTTVCVLPLAFIGCCVRVLVFLGVGYGWSEEAALFYWNYGSTATFYIISFLLIGLAWYLIRKALPGPEAF